MTHQVIKRTVFWQRIHLIAQLFAFAGCISMTIVNSIVERGGGGRSPYAWINRVQLAVGMIQSLIQPYQLSNHHFYHSSNHCYCN